MGMDGLSIANTGVVKESTSAELSAKTERAVQTDNTGKNVQGIGIDQRVQPKDEQKKDSQKQSKEEPQQEETFEDGLVEEPDDDLEKYEYEEDLIETQNKEFYVKLNIKDDIIELYDSTTNKLIETISGNELGELVQKLNMASGIFINKKV